MRRAFTLVELMVVIAIIAVLAAVITPQVFRQVAKGRSGSAESFHNGVKVGSTSYFSDIGQWPVSCTQANCNTMAGANGGFVSAATANANWDGPYIDRWPPANANPWGGNYTWVNASGANFGAAAAGERYITITAVPTADAQRIDVDKDGALGAATGLVRSATGAWPAAGNVVVRILVSRDGPVN